jgi:hypothetical protein
MSSHRRPATARRRASPSRSRRALTASPAPTVPGPALAASAPVAHATAVDAPAARRWSAATAPDGVLGRLSGLLTRHWGLAIVMLAFALTWTVVPVFSPTPVGDDWVYSLSVEYLLEDGEMRILDLSVTTLVVQVLWGGLFGAIFGDTFGAHRFSTVVLFALSGIAFYSLLRTLGVSLGRSALGAAAYLFNPLSFVLAFSFMTDPHYLGWMVISVAFFAAGLRPDRRSRRLILLGAFFAGCAFLVRQQGALIPLGVGVYLLLTRQLWFNVRSLVRLLEVAAIPAVMLVLYYLWLFFVHGVPEQQDQFVNQVTSAGVAGTWLLLRRMTYFETIMAGMFVLPIALAALVGLGTIVRRAVGPIRRPGVRLAAGVRLGALAGWLVIVLFGAWVTVGDDYLMPYVSQFVGVTGLGPNDLHGGRPALLEQPTLREVQLVITWLCVGSAVLLGAATIGRIGSPATPERAIAAMLLIVALGQVAGVMPPSFHFRNWIISVDRYLLPLLPFAIALLLWSLRGVRLAQPVGWLALAVVAAFSVVGTRDFLTFQKATWDYARYANYDLGIPLTQLNGGAPWDGYFLHEYGDTWNIPQQSVGGPWWNNLFATATDSTYVISGSPNAPGDGTYVMVGQREYSSWLNSEPVYLYLMQRVALPAGAPPAEPIPPGVPPPPIYAHPVS